MHLRTSDYWAIGYGLVLVLVFGPLIWRAIRRSQPPTTPVTREDTTPLP